MPALVILRDAALQVETVELPMAPVAVDVVQTAIILEIVAQMSAALEVSTDYDQIDDAMDCMVPMAIYQHSILKCIINMILKALISILGVLYG